MNGNPIDIFETSYQAEMKEVIQQLFSTSIHNFTTVDIEKIVDKLSHHKIICIDRLHGMKRSELPSTVEAKFIALGYVIDDPNSSKVTNKSKKNDLLSLPFSSSEPFVQLRPVSSFTNRLKLNQQEIIEQSSEYRYQ